MSAQLLVQMLIYKVTVFMWMTNFGYSRQVCFLKICLIWLFIDCSKNCSIGTLNAACDACTCAHHSLTGRVLTETDVPLSEANVSLAETPYNVLAQTNVSGYFSTIGLCADNQLELLITKVGFVPVKQKANVLTPTTATITAKMEIAGKDRCMDLSYVHMHGVSSKSYTR